MRTGMSRQNRSVLIRVLAVLLFASVSLEATPAQFGSHSYEFILVTDPFTGSNNSWFTASAAANASVFNGANGYLATITSQAENDFLFSLVSGLFTGFNGAWLGGKAPEGWLTGPETGQAFTYTNWGGVEPNNASYAYMNIGTATFGIGAAQWADDSFPDGFPEPGGNPVIGYFVEYDTTTVPEPSSLFLLAIGLAGVAARKRLTDR
jgi:hypothetical protein